MALKLQIMLIVIMVLAIVAIIRHISKNRLDYKLGLLWIFISVVLIVFAAWPRLLSKLSDLFGIYSPMNMMVFFGMILLVIIIFTLSSEISKLKEQVKQLSQELAILRKDISDEISGDTKDA